MAIGAAISGIMVVVGENVCGVDPQAQFKNGKVVHSAELERRVRLFQQWYDGYGTIVVQQNVEDNRLGVPEYAIEKLGVEAIEIKWGQGAKDIGGEIKIAQIEDAKELKKRGYILIPDPDDPVVEKAYEEGEFKEFERHSRLGMVDEEAFHKEVERLRSLGAKWVTLKTGAYRPVDLARAIKYASDAQIDLLTIDGSGGGTGMSPWRMMNEWGIPTVYLESLAYKMLEKLEKKGAFIPDIAIGGGISLEDQVFKALALGAPFVKAACMGRATLIPAMVGKHTDEWLKKGTLPKGIREYGRTVEEIFVLAEELKSRFGKDFNRLPLGAIGLYTYCDRIAVGLRQLMAGARKFALKHIDRDDLTALTPEAAKLSGIPYVMDADGEEVEKILG
jgi:glutamate synthase domain-containing protein 2